MPYKNGEPVFFILKGENKTIGALRREIYGSTGIRPSSHFIISTRGRIAKDTDDVRIFGDLNLPRRLILLLSCSNVLESRDGPLTNGDQDCNIRLTSTFSSEMVIFVERSAGAGSGRPGLGKL
jgi:hypothetical protein